ncbi:MAG: hypothetical protein EOO78_08300, partial [Oxalobacteraceae bacterium]
FRLLCKRLVGDTGHRGQDHFRVDGVGADLHGGIVAGWGTGSRESGIGNRESGIGNRESGIGNRKSACAFGAVRLV